MPTPTSGSTTGGNGSKRRRTGDHNTPGAGIYEDEPEEVDEEGAAAGGADEEGTPVPTPEDEEGDLRFYNPNQDPEQRRRLRATIRDHARMVDGKWSFWSDIHWY